MTSGQNQQAVYPSLTDKHIVITGGASGIGAELVQCFLAQGGFVSFLDIDDDSAQALIAEHGASRLAYQHCDIRDIDALRGAIAQFEAARPIDVLINNAANDSRHGFFDVEPDVWDTAQALNLKHQFFASQAVARGMVERGRGTIVLLGSVSWMRGNAEMSGYTTAKAGIFGLTKTMANALGESGVRVNSVAAGAVQTPRQDQLWMTPEREKNVLAAQSLKFRLQPSDIAAMVLFLAADDSRACTAQTFIVDGGLTNG